MTIAYSCEILNDLLPIYYKRLFPYDSYCRWLSAGSSDSASFLSRREFSFTLQDDIYLRYLSFSNAEELQKEMLKRLPHKIDIGAVYNAKPCDHKKISNFQPQEKEVVFDIDLTDYDDVRTCCSGAAICAKCWQFIIVAVKIIDRALREDFAYKHLLWIYSGRRGVHCWVSDPSAMRLGQAARSAIAEYLQVLSGGDQKTKKVLLRSDRIHPSIMRSVKIIMETFERLCLIDQDILGTPDRWVKVVALIPDEELRKEINEKMPQGSNSVDRWFIMRQTVENYIKIKKPDYRTRKTSNNVLKEIMLQFAYPRLDINVSKGLNHLLKSPFCIHPKTGRVCIPFDVTRVEHFDPATVPTICQLTDEIDKFGKDDENSHSKMISKDYKKTSLREPMKVFDEFLSQLSQTWRQGGDLMKRSDASMTF